MRKGLTFEAATKLHRRRGRSLIFAAIAWFVVGATLSAAVSSIWVAGRRDAAERRFQIAVELQHDRVETTVVSYLRMLSVTQAFFEVTDPSYRQFLKFSASLDIANSRPAVIALQFIQRRSGRFEGGGGVSYPVTMVAPATAAPTLLHSDLASDPSARAALELVGKSGSVTMTPPVANT